MSESCPSQKHATNEIVREHKKLRNRVGRDQISPVLQMSLFLFPCKDEKHKATPDFLHLDWVVDTYGLTPPMVASAITATEQLLAALKAKVQ